MVSVLNPISPLDTASPELAQLLATPPAPTAIHAENVSVSYPVGKGRKTIIDDLNLEIAQGEFVVLLGETGCGKSTLLRMMLGQELPTAGTVAIDGQHVDRVSARCGYVPQRYSLFPDRTVLGNIAFGPVTSGFHILSRLRPAFRKARREIRVEALRQLERLGLHVTDATKYPHQLSGGMQQRVAIAQALMMHPSILLMDEAFSALDPSTRKSLQGILRELWLERRPTVVFVTHNTAEALFLATRIIVLARQPGGAKVALDLRLPGEGMSLKTHGQHFLALAEQIEDCSRGKTSAEEETIPCTTRETRR